MVYRIKPGINENLPDDLEEPSENRLKKINDGQHKTLEYVQSNIKIEEHTEEEKKAEIEEQEKRKIKFELEMEYESKKNEIILSDKTDRSKKISLKKLEKEYRDKINE